MKGQISRNTGECYDYQYGFCFNGPNCQYRHVRRPPEEKENIKKIPDWYLEKIKSFFSRERLANYGQFQEYYMSRE